MNGLGSERVIRLSHDSSRLNVAVHRVTTSLSFSPPLSFFLSPSQPSNLPFVHPCCCPRRSSMREMRVRNTLSCWLSPFFHPPSFFCPSFPISPYLLSHVTFLSSVNHRSPFLSIVFALLSSPIYLQEWDDIFEHYHGNNQSAFLLPQEESKFDFLLNFFIYTYTNCCKM